MSSFQPQNSAAPKLCAAGCSFFGNPATDGMCSVCYKKHCSTINSGSDPSSAAAATASDAVVLSACAAASVVISGAVAAKPAASAAPATSVSFAPAAKGGVVLSSSSASEAAATKAEPNRCPACFKKVGLTGLLCRCGKTFCGRHRYAEEHGCTFDFKGAGRDKIARANPLITGEKLIGKI